MGLQQVGFWTGSETSKPPHAIKRRNEPRSSASTTKGIVMTDPKFPDVTVQLTGEDGNAAAIVGRVSGALRRAGHDPGPYVVEATSGDYDHLLQITMRWVTVV